MRVYCSINKDPRYLFDTECGIPYDLCRYNSDTMEEYSMNEYFVHYHKDMFWSWSSLSDLFFYELWSVDYGFYENIFCISVSWELL
jgi:hypothetical protein